MKKSLQAEIDNLEKSINSSTSEVTMAHYTSLQSELESIYDQRAKGAVLRSKVNEVEYGEKNSKYFLNIEKNNYKAKHIKKLITENGEIISTQSAILSYQQKYYTDLLSTKFTASDTDRISYTKAFFDNLNITKLSTGQRNFCEQPLTISECKKAIDKLSSGKSPGSDGFTADFYKFFWDDIKHLVFDSFNYSFQHGSLSIDQKRGILSLNPKKEKDIRYLKIGVILLY